MRWNRQIKGFGGSRWSCYETYVKGRVDMTWEEFKTEVMRRNPVLKEDGYVFRPDRAYIIPTITDPVIDPSFPANILDNVPYFSQLDVPHTDGRYWGTDPDRRDDTPDGCWMNQLRDGSGFGREAQGCPGPMEKGCIRPGSCNVTSLFMLMKHLGLERRPQVYPDGQYISDWLRREPLTPTWLYTYMMDYWGGGKQVWDGVNPTSAMNSVHCARGDYMSTVLRQFAAEAGKNLDVSYTASVTLSEYRRAIDGGSPVILNSRKMHHVIVGIGYTYHDQTSWMVAHDPYGKRREDLSGWENYNGCGNNDTHGRGVRYPFHELDPVYMLYPTP